MLCKPIVLTIDYEIFFGENSGTVQNCMIRPTELLASLLRKHNSKMTVFWDVLHYWKLLQLEDKYPELKNDRVQIEKQIHELLREGHEVQLHIHSHWLDSNYENGKWRFHYENYTLHDLVSKPTSIKACVRMAKETMEKVCHESIPGYQVDKFRAGGLRIEPFSEIKEAFLESGINIDSSLAYGLCETDSKYPYDYRKIPQKSIYRFIDATHREDGSGKFTEVPISTIKTSVFYKLYFLLVKKILHRRTEKFGDGIGKGFSHIRTSKLEKIKNLCTSSYSVLTTENQIPAKIRYLFRKAKQCSVTILHPKNMNSLQLVELERLLSKNKIRFISLEERIKLWE